MGHAICYFKRISRRVRGNQVFAWTFGCGKRPFPARRTPS